MRILLVHGLGRTPVSTWGLARFLRSRGHVTEHFGYVAAVEPFAQIRTRLRARLERVAADGPYAVMGHSLGGLLLRDALHQLEPAPVHFVMLGTPNRPPRMARRAGRWWPFRLATGEAGQLLARPEFFQSLPLPAVPYTIVAGTAGLRGRWSPFGDEPNDWVVAVSETRIHDHDEPILMPVEHTFMMGYQRVRMAVAGVLP